MRLVILDYLQRWRWLLLPALPLHILGSVGIWSPALVYIPIAVLAVSPFVLSNDLQRGAPRTILALPITAGRLGKAWWWVSVGLPSLALTLTAPLSALLATLVFPNPEFSLSRWLILLFFPPLILGTLFLGLAGLPARPADFLKPRGLFFGLIWGCSIPVLVMTPQVLRLSSFQIGAGFWIFVTILSICSIASWFQAERFVTRRTERISVDDTGGSSRKATFRNSVRPGQGGLPYLIGTVSTRGFLFGLALLSLMFIVSTISTRGLSVNSDQRNYALEQMPSQIFMSLMILGMIGCFLLLPQLRVLRTLPIRRGTLAALLVCWPILFTLISGLCYLGLLAFIFPQDLLPAISLSSLQPDQQAETVLDLMMPALLILSLTLIGMPWLLHHGMNAKGMTGILSIMILGQLIIITIHVPTPIAVVLFLISTLLGWWLSYRSLGTSAPWRILSSSSAWTRQWRSP